MNCAARICCAAIASILMSGAAFANATDIGKAAVVVPDAKSTSVEKEERSLQVGTDVFKDDIVQTGNIGAVMLQFTDKTTLKIFPNSKVKLDNYVYDADKTVLRVGLNLLSGAMRIASGGPHTADKYQLQTPQATIGIRGTVIHIVSDNERTVIEALHGTFHACATTGSACRTVSATDDMNAVRMWSDGRIELARVQRDLGVRSAQGSSAVSATQPVLLGQNVTSNQDFVGRDRGVNDANRQLPVNLDQSQRFNLPVASISTVSIPTNSVPNSSQNETATPNSSVRTVASLSVDNTPTNSAPNSAQSKAATSSSSVRSFVDSFFEFVAESGASQSTNGGTGTGGAPTPEVNAFLGLALAGSTVAFLRRKRGRSASA